MVLDIVWFVFHRCEGSGVRAGLLYGLQLRLLVGVITNGIRRV